MNIVRQTGAEFIAHRHAVHALIADDLRQRWSGGILSWGWSVLQPMALIAVFAVVFSTLMASKGFGSSGSTGYVIFLCLGMFPWLAVSDCLVRGTGSLLAASQLLKRAPLPLILFPTKTVCAAWIVAGVSLALVMVVAPFLGVAPQWTWLLAPLPLMSLILTSFGAAIGLAVFGCLIRDTANVVQLLLPLMMWSAPIVYSPDILPQWAQACQAYHPLSPAISILRELIISGTCPSISAWVVLFAWPFAVLVMGFSVLGRLGGEVRDNV